MTLSSPCPLLPSLVSIGLVFCHLNTWADTKVERVISVESSSFSVDASTTEIAISAEDLDELTVDFSDLEEELSVPWNGPPGKLIEITRHAGFDPAFPFAFVPETGRTSSDDGCDDIDPSIVYANLSGATPSSVGRLIRLVDGVTVPVLTQQMFKHHESNAQSRGRKSASEPHVIPGHFRKSTN